MHGWFSSQFGYLAPIQLRQVTLGRQPTHGQQDFQLVAEQLGRDFARQTQQQQWTPQTGLEETDRQAPQPAPLGLAGSPQTALGHLHSAERELHWLAFGVHLQKTAQPLGPGPSGHYAQVRRGTAGFQLRDVTERDVARLGA